MWHHKLWLIDHGAALYFHHSWADINERSKDRFSLIKDHVLLQLANALEAADETMKSMISDSEIRRIVRMVPDEWLLEPSPFSTPAEHRQAYIDYLLRRLEEPRSFVEEAIRARSVQV